MNDDIPNVEVMILLLERFGYHAIGASSSIHALEILENQKVDLIISNIMRFSMDGWEFTKVVKSKPAWKDIPIIISSAVSYHPEYQKMYGHLIEEYLNIPVLPRELIEIIEQVLERNGRKTGQVYTKKRELSVMPTIVIVNDSPMIVDVFLAMLERGGYHAIGTYSSAECLELLQDYIPDLILSNVMRDEMDGWEFLMHVKSNPKTRDIPVAMLTAKTITPDELEQYEPFYEDYLAIPIGHKNFYEAIEHILKKKT